MTRHSPFRKLLNIILHSSLTIRTPIKDLHEKPTSCTRLQRRFRYIYDRQVVAVEWKGVEVMTSSPKRPEAALVFFVLKWRGWRVGITYLKQVDLFVRVESSSKPALNSFSSFSRLPAFSIRPLGVVGSPHSPPAVWKVSRQRPPLDLSTTWTNSRRLSMSVHASPNTNSRMRGGRSAGRTCQLESGGQKRVES